MGLFDALRASLTKNVSSMQNAPSLPMRYTPNAGFLKNLGGAVDAFMQAQPDYMQNQMQRQQLLSSRLENQNLPLANALKNYMMLGQGQGQEIENQYKPQTLQSDIGLKNAQAAQAYRMARAPYSNMGESIADYANIAKQYGAGSKEAQAAAYLMQQQGNKQQGAIGMTEDGMPVMMGGAGGPSLYNILNPQQGAQAGLPQANMAPQGNLPMMLAAAGNQMQPNMQSALLPKNGIYIKNAMTGGARGGAGATYFNPMTGETITTPTTSDVSDIQERMRAIEGLLPLLDKLEQTGKSKFYGRPIFGDDAANYNSTLDNAVDKYVVSSNLPKTNEGIAKAEGVLKRKETEHDDNYSARIKEEKKTLIKKYKELQTTLAKGYKSSRGANFGIDGNSLSNISDTELLKMLGGQ
jgi:hypothetical protein